LERGDGPIALVLTHSRELAQQTLAVATRFFQRTSGEDALRAAAVFGGVDPASLLPSNGAPDFGRWSELLVATPGRLLELMKRLWINLDRTTYVVLDEADLLLSRGWKAWLPQVKAILSRIRPERQLLMFSATWPESADQDVDKLCGSELVKIRVDPQLRPVPQDVRLFDAQDNSKNVADRLATLAKFLSEECHADESVVVFCQKHETAQHLANSTDLQEAVGDGVTLVDWGGRTEEVEPDGNGPYARFVRGEAKVLFTTFAMGARGLDYSMGTDTSAHRLSLAVIIFDFPPTVIEYAHCIGRTARPGQLNGRAIVFMQEMRFWIAEELAAVLDRCGQPLSQDLAALITKNNRFLDECRQAMENLKEGKTLQLPSDGIVGDFNAKDEVWILPAGVPSYRRRMLHMLADEVGVYHVSTGSRYATSGSEARRLHIARAREALPEMVFLQGEAVDVASRLPGESPSRGVIANSRVEHRGRRRSINVRFEDGSEMPVPLEAVRLRSGSNGVPVGGLEV